jgi:hypothetical protein
MANKRAALPGLAGGPEQKYPTIFPKTKRTTIVYVQPTGGFQNSSPTIRFDVRLGPSEIARFIDEPITITYRATVVNPTYAAGNQEADRKDPRQYTQPLELEPNSYVNPLLRGASFFTKVEVNIDGQKVSPEGLEDRNFLYQCLNRIYATDNQKKRKYGTKAHHV